LKNRTNLQPATCNFLFPTCNFLSLNQALMFGDGSLTFQEFAMREPLPLATIHDAILEFLRGRTDAVLFGAQAVNAYLDEPRMTQDVDILSMNAEQLGEELRTFLNHRFQIAVRVRTVAHGKGYRLYQIGKLGNRHLADVRQVEQFPACNLVEQVLVPTPPELISQKLQSMVARLNTRKGMMDAADLRGLLLAFPELKTIHGSVTDALHAAQSSEKVLAAWHDLVAQEILPENDEDGF